MSKTMLIIAIVVLCISGSICGGLFAFYKEVPSDNYIKSENMDKVGSDIGCYDGVKIDYCKEKCDADVNCKAYNVYNGGTSCCTKTVNSPLSKLDTVDFYAKK